MDQTTKNDPVRKGGVPAEMPCQAGDCTKPRRGVGYRYCASCAITHTPPGHPERPERVAPQPAPSLAGDAQARKASPMFEGLLGYFPNALAVVAHVSKVGNDQQNPGLPMQWAFEKSSDEKDCLLRHLAEAGTFDTSGTEPVRHSAKVAWRALAALERELLKADPGLKPGVNVTGFTRDGGGK